jgi:fatty acid desaturase
MSTEHDELPAVGAGRSRHSRAGNAANLLLAILHTIVAIHAYLVLPLCLLPLNAAWGWTLLPVVLLTNPLWALLHETIHGAFHHRPSVNALAGRVLAIGFASPWRVLRVGHLLHHRFNRTPLDRAEVSDVVGIRRVPAVAGYYFQLLIGLYLSQLLSPLAFVLPKSLLVRARRRYCRPESFTAHAAAQLIRPPAIREIRIDGALIAALLGFSAWSYGSHAWMLAALLAGRGFLISFLDYVYHYGTPVGDLRHGRDLRLSPWLSAFLLHFNLHGVHHRHPNRPWYDLPRLFAAKGGCFDGDYFAAALTQLRGPLRRDQLPAVAPTATASPFASVTHLS